MVKESAPCMTPGFKIKHEIRETGFKNPPINLKFIAPCTCKFLSEKTLKIQVMTGNKIENLHIKSFMRLLTNDPSALEPTQF